MTKAALLTTSAAQQEVAQDPSWDDCDKGARAKAIRAAAKAKRTDEKLRRKQDTKWLEEAENDANSKVKGANKGSLEVTRAEFDKRKLLMATIVKCATAKPAKAEAVKVDEIKSNTNREQDAVQADDVDNVALVPGEETMEQASPQVAATATSMENVPAVTDTELVVLSLPAAPALKNPPGKLRSGSVGLFDSQHPRNQFARKPRASTPSRVSAMPDEPDWCLVDWSASGTLGLASAILRQSASRTRLSNKAAPKAEAPVPITTLKQLTQQSTAKFFEQKPHHCKHESMSKRSRSSSARPGKMLQGRCR